MIPRDIYLKNVFTDSEYSYEGDSYLGDLSCRFPFVKRGMKVSTFLSKVTAMERPESLKQLTPEEQETYLLLKSKVKELNPVEIEYSKLFENKSVKGNIAISIDPIDYLLMSTNKSGWQSCYALSKCGESRNYGDYVAGLFSYMCDKTTLISYRHGTEQVVYKIGNSKFTEYSKNWRQVIYLDTDTWGFACSRQYPFEDEELAKNVRLFFEGILSNNLNLQDDWGKRTITGDSVRKFVRVFDFPHQTLSYNDILHRGVGTFVYNKGLFNTFKGMRLNVDSNPRCPMCGEHYLSRSCMPICEECREGGQY